MTNEAIAAFHAQASLYAVERDCIGSVVIVHVTPDNALLGTYAPVAGGTPRVIHPSRLYASLQDAKASVRVYYLAEAKRMAEIADEYSPSRCPCVL